MIKSISQRAADPFQYDKDEIIWHEEGGSLSPIRRLFLEVLDTTITDLRGKRVLDIGCGQGWLTEALRQNGAISTGVDPSRKNIEAARNKYPLADFAQMDLNSIESDEIYDAVCAVMVFEHIDNLKEGYEKISRLLRPGGRLLMIVGDFNKFTKPRHGYILEIESISPEEVATRTDYGERAGVIYDINRTPKKFVNDAAEVGFDLLEHRPIPAPRWLVEEQPRYRVHGTSPLFHLLEFYKPDAE